MSARSGLVVELRFQVEGHLIEAFIPPVIFHDGPLPEEPVHWYLQVNRGSSFLGPPYAIYFRGQESLAEAELRRFLTDDSSAAAHLALAQDTHHSGNQPVVPTI
ncbi:MAG TPA: hypothetical protein VGP87_12320 [Gemmatimonadales bacterium]|jgi:hypothetical protein|nr:hypothetical protein [Gemmatimonadales bacterium]